MLEDQVRLEDQDIHQYLECGSCALMCGAGSNVPTIDRLAKNRTADQDWGSPW